jgi:hypothetical protein
VYKTSVTELDEGDVFAYADESPFIDLTDGLDTLTKDERSTIDWHEVVHVQFRGSILDIAWKSSSYDSGIFTERVADHVKVVVWEDGDDD